MIAIVLIILTLLAIIALSFGVACLVTWAFVFIAGLLGTTISFSWKLVLAIWIIISLFNSATTIKVKEG